MESQAERIFPITIHSARYGGTYEGGKWIAHWNFPWAPEIQQAMGDDLSCSTFFMLKGFEVGIGDTPDEALANLKDKIKAGLIRDPVDVLRAKLDFEKAHDD